MVDSNWQGMARSLGRSAARRLLCSRLAATAGSLGRQGSSAGRHRSSGSKSRLSRERAESMSSRGRFRIRQVCSILARSRGNRMAPMDYRTRVAREGRFRPTDLFIGRRGRAASSLTGACARTGRLGRAPAWSVADLEDFDARLVERPAAFEQVCHRTLRCSRRDGQGPHGPCLAA